MPIMYRENVERVVSDDAVTKWQQRGYKLSNAQIKAEEVKTSKAEETPTENVNIEPEANQEAGEGNELPINPPEEAGEDAGTAEDPQAAQNTDYEAMNVQQLRKVAKDLGVQGYNNMNRATLLAVIAAH